MFRIDEFKIEGFWGRYTAAAQLDEDVNIFIGRNGTGKTTLINLLQAVLDVDLRLLLSLEFKEVTLKLRDGNRKRTIRVTKEDKADLPFEHVTFQVATRKYRLPLYSREIDSERYLLRRPNVRAQYQELREQIHDLVNLSAISVHRDTRRVDVEEEVHGGRWRSRAPIDVRLHELVQGLTEYQLSLAEEANAVSSRFQNDVLASILYSPEFDKMLFEDVQSVEMDRLREDLTRAYSELGALDEKIQKRINAHITALRKSFKAVQEFHAEKKGLMIDDIMPLPLLRRTQHITNLSLEAEKAKQDIFAPVRRFVDVIQTFISGKTATVGARGGVVFATDQKDIAIAQLSSGEKQILVFLTETLLQREQTFIFIADEPELSLHIEWQAKMVGSLKLLNPNAQVILATHSPEIAAGYSSNVIDMESIVQ